MKKRLVVFSVLVTAVFAAGCETMDPKLRAAAAAVACGGIVYSADSSSDRGRNAAAAAIACYIGAYLLLSKEEQKVAVRENEKLLKSDPTTQHSSTVTFPESGKTVETRVGSSSTQEIDISSPSSDSNKTKIAEVLCRPSTMESKNANGQVIGTYEENFCRVNGDWYPESEARRMLST